ncbi:hypothetical protein [Haloglycomyces albus]|uniref:hypothetical protein n=1 Tax=Haloglycomyces albus TaxID=526067 RepID=UPI0012EC72A8|nr:hypothetical protein [Haloglycomyces albus]
MRFNDDECIFCDTWSSPRGEHLLPQWVMRFHAGDCPGEHRAEVNGEPLTLASGAPVRVDTPIKSQFQLPCCNNHNEELNANYEYRATPVVKKMLGGIADDPVWPVLNDDEVFEASRWWIKTVALLAHRCTTVSWAKFRYQLNSDDSISFDDSVYDSIGQGRIPGDMSAWLVVADSATIADPYQVLNRIPLATISKSGATPTTPYVRNFGLRTRFDRQVFVQVAHHPNAEIVHPDEVSGNAVRIWPTSTRLALSELPLLNSQCLYAFQNRFLVGGSMTGLNGHQGLIYFRAFNPIWFRTDDPGILAYVPDSYTNDELDQVRTVVSQVRQARSS